MALIHCNFFSEALGLSTAMYVILPQETKGQIGMKGSVIAKKHPTLYLLHGLSDDYTIWLRRTSIERYAADKGLAVVMPAVGRSFYADMKYGYKYWTFISEEVPEIARSFFPLSDKREDNFVAGLSMGGYGAFKMGLACPDKFAAAASLSGVLDVSAFEGGNADKSGTDAHLAFGSSEELKGSINDLNYLASKLAESKEPKPKLFQCCGTEDALYQNNLKFRDYLNKLGVFDLKYVEGPGTHEWGFWDKHIQDVLNWLPLKNKE